MGLLDLLANDTGGQGLLGLHLLAAAGPSAQPASFGQRLLSGMQGFRAAQAAEEDRRQRLQMQQAQMGLLGAQLDETRAQAAQRAAAVEDSKRQAAERARLSDVVRRAFMPTQAIDANSVSGVTGPRPEALGVVGQQAPVNYQALIAQGVPADLVKGLADAANYGRNKVARTVERSGPNGMPETVQLDEYGATVGSGLPKPVELKLQDLGGAVQAYNPFALQPGQQFRRTNTPDALLSALTTRRGQDMTDARARDKNQIDASAVGKVEWKQDTNGAWLGFPREVTSAGPVTPVQTTAPGKREMQARNAITVIDQAGPLIDKATGSYAGAGVDMAARVFGASTKGSEAAAQLQALEGALMMAQPRMEGPQSDKDVVLYRQMAGKIGDPTVPRQQKHAALAVIRELHTKYAGAAQGAPANSAPPSEFRVLGVE